MGKSNLTARLATAGIATPVLFAILYWGPAWGWLLVTLVGVGLAGWEVFGMSHPRDRVARGMGAVHGLILSTAVYVYTDEPRVLLSLLVGSVIVGLLLPLWRLGDIGTAALRVFAGVAAPLYVALLTSIALLRRDMGEAGPGYVLMTLMFAWLADTGGYFAGRFLGRHRLYPAVSPNKTWEGFFGALAGALVAALLAHFIYLPSLPLTHAVLLALVAGSLGQLGDLAESLLKRSTAVKDSGSLLPGHGGMLDRIDALLVVGPVVWLYAVWFGSPQ